MITKSQIVTAVPVIRNQTVTVGFSGANNRPAKTKIHER